MIGTSQAMSYVRFKMEQIAATDTTVLILGETGVGKGMVAEAIHHKSGRKKQSLVKVNCTALSPTLIESELFGHERGSFTGAVKTRIGRFELADRGTLFLDEIGELPPNLQGKLLRVLEEKEFERIGGSRTIRSDVRIIAATNKNLEKEIDRGNFREDLWYRLSVYPLTVPPLRERREDIGLIAEYFSQHFAKKMSKQIDRLDAQAFGRLAAKRWPGNVRELKNVIERAVINATGSTLILDDSQTFSKRNCRKFKTFKPLSEMEREHILAVLQFTGWKVSGKNSAAEILALDRSTLRRKIKKLDISQPSS